MAYRNVGQSTADTHKLGRSLGISGIVTYLPEMWRVSQNWKSNKESQICIHLHEDLKFKTINCLDVLTENNSQYLIT